MQSPTQQSDEAVQMPSTSTHSLPGSPPDPPVPAPPAPSGPQAKPQLSDVGRQSLPQHSPGSVHPWPMSLQTSASMAASRQRLGNWPPLSGGRGSLQMPETHWQSVSQIS